MVKGGPKAVKGFWISLVSLVASIVVVSTVLENQDLSLLARVIIALIPPACFIVYIFFLVAALGHLDEFQRRVHLEALAFAYPALALAIFLCEYLRKAGVIDYLLPDHVLAMMIAIVALSYVVSWRRYQ